MLLKVLFLLIVCDYSLQKTSLKVAVHYESLQEASKAAMVTSIIPGYEQLKDDVDFDFELVPYGNSNVLKDGTVKCPQGENECLANKIQICALAQKDTTLHNRMMFVKCALKQYDPSDTFLLNVCIKYWKFDIDSVKACYEGDRGNQLLKDYGKKADPFNFSSAEDRIPAVTFNGVYDEKDSKQARDHFVYVVCDMLKNKPNVCSTLEY